MLARLSIRDIVLIERLDIEFSRGLAVLTGETGAGKSILLDAFALALGGRIAVCSMRSQGMRRTSPRWKSCGMQGAPPTRHWRNTAPAWNAPRARRTICAMLPRN